MSSEYSAGARYERKALRDYLTRRAHALAVRVNQLKPIPSALNGLEGALRWVKTRQRRYDKRPGGL